MIVLGRVSAPYGVQGWVKVQAFGDDSQVLAGVPRWWLGRDPDDGQGWRLVELLDRRQQGGVLIARLEGIADRTAAKALEGLYVGAPREELPAPRDDEFYWGDLIGLSVVTEHGDSLGTVTGLIESGAHEVLVVRVEQSGAASDRERLLPFVANVIRQVDLAAGVICVDWGADW